MANPFVVAVMNAFRGKLAKPVKPPAGSGAVGSEAVRSGAAASHRDTPPSPPPPAPARAPAPAPAPVPAPPSVPAPDNGDRAKR